MNNKIENLISEQAIKKRNQELGMEISKNLDDDAIVIGLLQGAFIFMADIVRELANNNKFPQTDFLWLSSYGDGQASGRLNILADLQRPISGKQILLVDDVYDTGKTLVFAQDYLKAKGAKEVLTCLLATKPASNGLPKPDFVGFELPDKFLIGYGLDDGGKGRGIPFIGAVKS